MFHFCLEILAVFCHQERPRVVVRWKWRYPESGNESYGKDSSGTTVWVFVLLPLSYTCVSGFLCVCSLVLLLLSDTVLVSSLHPSLYVSFPREVRGDSSGRLFPRSGLLLWILLRSFSCHVPDGWGGGRWYSWDFRRLGLWLLTTTNLVRLQLLRLKSRDPSRLVRMCEGFCLELYCKTLGCRLPRQQGRI